MLTKVNPKMTAWITKKWSRVEYKPIWSLSHLKNNIAVEEDRVCGKLLKLYIQT